MLNTNCTWALTPVRPCDSTSKSKAMRKHWNVGGKLQCEKCCQLYSVAIPIKLTASINWVRGFSQTCNYNERLGAVKIHKISIINGQFVLPCHLRRNSRYPVKNRPWLRAYFGLLFLALLCLYIILLIPRESCRYVDASYLIFFQTASYIRHLIRMQL